jgi:hypothetical protein
MTTKSMISNEAVQIFPKFLRQATEKATRSLHRLRRSSNEKEIVEAFHSQGLDLQWLTAECLMLANVSDRHGQPQTCACESMQAKYRAIVEVCSQLQAHLEGDVNKDDITQDLVTLRGYLTDCYTIIKAID